VELIRRQRDQMTVPACDREALLSGIKALFRDQFVRDFQGIADRPSADSKLLTPPIGSMTFSFRHQIGWRS
jgi:hypothetical protein